MQATVELQAYLAQHSPSGEAVFPYTLPEGATVQTLVRQLNLPEELAGVIVLNERSGDFEDALHDGDRGAGGRRNATSDAASTWPMSRISKLYISHLSRAVSRKPFSMTRSSRPRPLGRSSATLTGSPLLPCGKNTGICCVSTCGRTSRESMLTTRVRRGRPSPFG